MATFLEPGYWTKPAEVRVLKTKRFKKGQPVPWRFKPGTTATITWIEVVLREGKNRQIRRLCRRSDFELTRLHRVSVGPILLHDLKEGSSRELTRREVEALYKRCLPLDPICPTIHQVRHTLRYCILQATLRIGASGSSTQPPSARLCNGEKTCADAGKSTPMSTCGPSSRLAASPGMVTRLGCVVRNILDFARRDVHETLEGPDEDCDAPEFCPGGEEESLRRARAVPPNESHMSCGYRNSQTERG
ncbi:unnamed protein product [Sphacelaria rigidula]